MATFGHREFLELLTGEFPELADLIRDEDGLLHLDMGQKFSCYPSGEDSDGIGFEGKPDEWRLKEPSADLRYNFLIFRCAYEREDLSAAH